MDTVLALLIFIVLVTMLWDIRRGQRITDAIVRDSQEMLTRVEASAERIAQMTAEVLRRTPER